MSFVFAAGVMLVSGAANTLLMKFQVLQQVPESALEKPVPFDHPYLQTLFMMFGELLCLFLYTANVKGWCGLGEGRKGSQSETGSGETSSAWPSWYAQALFILPVMCDMTATTLVNYAYLLIPASVIQMTRGAIVIFTCLFSVIFLGRQQKAHHWAGVLCVSAGITCVSLSQLETGNGGSGVSMGITLCVVAQMFQAAMMVVEEKVLHSYTIAPLLAIGLEGFFGCIMLSVVIPIVATTTHQENVQAAFYQLAHSTPLLLAVLASVLSIAFFNWSGITVTQKASCVARSTIDCSRTAIIWVFELYVGWASFQPLQLLGFCILMLGTLLYNEVIRLPFLDALNKYIVTSSPSEVRASVVPATVPVLPDRPEASRKVSEEGWSQESEEEEENHSLLAGRKRHNASSASTSDGHKPALDLDARPVETEEEIV